MYGEYLKSKINTVKRCRIFKKERGMTLVEVVIAFFVLSFVTLIMVQSVMMSMRAAELNKSRTEAIALANTELEEIRLRNYSEVGIIGAVGGDPEGSLESESVVDYNGTEYIIRRTVTWVDGEYSYKLIEIEAENDDMTVPVSVVTQLYPKFGEGGPPLADYPPVTDLTISGTRIQIWIWVSILLLQLDWSEPEAANTIDYYEIYRDGSLYRTSNITRWGTAFMSGDHTFYVVVVYDDGMRSDPSNVVDTRDL